MIADYGVFGRICRSIVPQRHQEWDPTGLIRGEVVHQDIGRGRLPAAWVAEQDRPVESVPKFPDVQCRKVLGHSCACSFWIGVFEDGSRHVDGRDGDAKAAVEVWRL